MADVIASAFDSAGQRCSALRVLCLQEEIADRVLAMLEGAMKELTIGRTDRLAVDVGPVISQQAKSGIDQYIEAMRSRGYQAAGPEANAYLDELVEPLPPRFARRGFGWQATDVDRAKGVSRSSVGAQGDCFCLW